MNSTFSNGMPNNDAYRDDALELLDLLSHSHFLMHPLGLPTNAGKYLACPTAGGMPRPSSHFGKSVRRKRKIRALSPSMVGASISEPGIFKYPSEPLEPEEDNMAERRGVRRKVSSSIISPSLPLSRSGSAALFTFGKQCFSRQSSSGSLMSDTEDSERSEKESDVDSECEAIDTGYVSNCEYFIVTTQSFDIEEQHSLQASISDGWMVTRKPSSCTVPVFYRSNDCCWGFSNDRPAKFQNNVLSNMPSNHSRSNSDISIQSESNDSMQSDHLPTKRSFLLGAPLKSKTVNQNQSSAAPGDLLSPPASPLFYPVRESGKMEQFASFGNTASNKPLELGESFDSDLIEPMPSCLALYRLICLFDINCSMYNTLDESSAWSVKVLHKKTGGVVNFQDYNGMRITKVLRFLLP